MFEIVAKRKLPGLALFPGEKCIRTGIAELRVQCRFCFDVSMGLRQRQHMEFPEGFHSVKDTAKDIAAIRSGRLLIELLADGGAFGPIVAIKTMQLPVPLVDFLPQVGNLPAGGMADINSQLNLIPEE